MTQFHTAAASSPYRTLLGTATTFTAIHSGAACGSGSTCSLPTNNKSFATTVPSQASTTDGTTMSYGSATPLSFYNAAINTGMGIINIEPDFSVSLPANVTYVGAYSTDITITVASAP